jgi:hypothetical protein
MSNVRNIKHIYCETDGLIDRNYENVINISSNDYLTRVLLLHIVFYMYYRWRLIFAITMLMFNGFNYNKIKYN